VAEIITNYELAFKKLEEIRNNLKHYELSYIIELIKKSLIQIPFPTAKLSPGLIINRVRFNPAPEETLYYSEESISYIRDKNVINNILTDYGRANKPHEVIFYGSLESAEIPDQRVTAVYEKSDLLKSKDSVNLKGELYTLSSWEVINEMIVVEVPFSDIAIKSNQDIKKAFEVHLNQIQNHPDIEFFLKQLKFFSEEFARDVNSGDDYKISVAYTDLALNQGGYSGVIYPSVQTGFKGLNIALKTSAVDNNLILKNVSTIRLHKNKEHAFINNHKVVVDFGLNNSNFKWENADKINVMPPEKILEELS
jgi:hypothetical protein